MRKNNIVIYTAIFGDKDDILDPDFDIPGCDLICITDNPPTQASRFKILRKDLPYNDHRLNSRYFKLFPHLLFPEYEYSIWIDGRVEIRNPNVGELVEKYLDNTTHFASFKHPHHKDIIEEAEGIIKQEKGEELKVLRQVYHYMHHEHAPIDYAMLATGVLVRRHNQPELAKFHEVWWNEILKHSKRDQISFNYAAWKCKLKYAIISGYIWDNQYFYIGEHKNKDL